MFIFASLLALGRTRELLSLSALAAVTIGFLIGAAPFLSFNLSHHGQTFVELSWQESSGHLSLGQLMSQLGATLSIGLPATFGSPQVCVAPRALYAGYTSYPVSAVRQVALSACQGMNLANMLFALVILGVYGAAIWPLLRVGLHETRKRLSALNRKRAAIHDMGVTTASGPLGVPALPAHAADPEQAARLWLRCMLILVALGTIAQYALSRRAVGPDEFVAVRYLLPLYVTLPIVIGTLWEALAAGWPGRRALSAGRAWLRSGLRSALAGGALALLLTFFLAGGVQAVVTASDSSRFALPATPDQQVMAKLRDLGITAYYGDYWTCYNLVFESGERLHCSSYPKYERYAAYAVYLSHVQHPAYLMLVGSVGGRTFEQTTAPRLYRAGYVRTEAGGIAIYYLPTPA
jgi:hypothetical protein